MEGIQSIMGDGIICGIVGVDRDGNAITPYINYLDSRTTKDVQTINAMDLDIWGKETGNAEANCMFPAMFARWFLENSKAFQEKAQNLSIMLLIFWPILRGFPLRICLLTGAPCPDGDLGIMYTQKNGPKNSWIFLNWI